ncbi:MAG: amino acid adenylation domain-containing protein [Pyrinomonadaceae bacterium]
MDKFPEQVTGLSSDKRELLEMLLGEEDGDGVTFPLSSSQQRLWFLDQLDPGSAVYNISTAVRLSGPLSISALEQSLNEIIRRHEALRTTFATVDGQPVQLIAPSLTLALPVVELERFAEAEREAEAMRLAREEAQRPFDLARGPLLRVTALRLGEQDHLVLLTMHHIVSDGWSMSIFISEMAALYEAFAAEQPSPLPELSIQYADFAEWERQHLQGQLVEEQLAYWKRQLGGSLPVLPLRTDRPRPATQSFRGARHPLALSQSLTASLKALSQSEGATLFMTLLAAFQTLLYRYTGQEDISVGTSVAGRSHAETEGLIGFFLNTLVLRTDLSGNPGFRELLRQVREVALGAYTNQEVPVEMLLEALQPNRDLSHTPLFQVLFILQNTPKATLKIGDLTLNPLEIETNTAKFDLTLDLAEKEKEIHGWLEYNTDLFDVHTIARMTRHFKVLLESIVVDPDHRLSDLSLLTADERQQLQANWDQPQATSASDLCLHQLFEAQVERSPEAVAVLFEKEQLTYRELNERANQLAHYLRRLGVGPEVRVGICAERSIEMLVGLLAILKAGGAYVPLDPASPPERLAFMLEDAEAPILLTQERLLNKFPEQKIKIVCLDADAEAFARESLENPVTGVAAGNAAYIIYTSGSTGQPKGVQIQHASVVSYVETASDEYELQPADRVLQFASISFDASAEEIYPCLARGGTLVLRTDAMLGSASEFLQKCEDWKLTVLDLPTAYWHELTAKFAREVQAFPSDIRLVIIGGEKALPERLAAWQELVDERVRLVNTYGPTEATIVATMCELPGKASGNGASLSEVPIGRAMRNAQAYVLDNLLQPVPVGIPGELCIGGAGLARGYLNRPELTAEKFVPHPFSTEPGARLYRTGDLVRYLPDGNIEFLGRVDHQVKIRGYRIELGEVESTLARHPAVRDALIIAREDVAGERRLVAYVIAQSETPPTVSEMRSFLKDNLAEYMVPSAFVILDEFPLSPSGKVDRRALPAPELSRPTSEQAYVAPRTPTEEVLVAVWSEVLGLEQVGAYDNFFELGGHSLLATQVISRIREVFQIEFPLRSFFEAPTLAELAESLESAICAAHKVELPPILPVIRDDKMPLSFAQERLWFLNQLSPDSVAYHVLRPMRLRGPLDVSLLERAFMEIVRRHEIYRTSFPAIDGRPIQRIHPPHPVILSPIDLSELPAAEREARIEKLIADEGQRPFDLANGPLWRLTLLRCSAEDHLLMLTEHHLVHDGWTEGRLVHEFLTIYSAFSAGQPSPLPELPIQYADFAAWQRECLQSQILGSQLDYWKKQLSGALPVLELPTDRPRPAVESFRGATQELMLSEALRKDLADLSRRHGCTLFMTLFSAFNVLLHGYSKQEDIIVGSPIAGRNRAELESLIGFFVNTMALRSDLSGDPTFLELLERTREVALGAYAHQDMPFEKLVEEVQPQRNLNRQAIFQVMFVLHNAPSTALEIPGLAVDAMRVHNGTSKFDLLLSMREEAEGLHCIMEYNTDIFDEATIVRMLSHLRTLLEGIVAAPEQPISGLPLLTNAERHQLLVEWNDTSADYPHDRCLTELFEAQVAQTPQDIAVTFEEEQLTYRELNERANKLAHYLRACGAGPEVRLAICLSRSPEMIVAVLGVLKAGGAYVALDSTYPKERLGYMLEDASVSVILTEERLAGALPASDAILIRLDTDGEAIARRSPENLPAMTNAESLVYVTYTSGSTGKPKGIAMVQRPLLNLITWMIRHTELPEKARTLQFASLGFDVSFQDIFSTLCSGGTVVMISEAVRQDIGSLWKVLTEREVHRLFIPAVALQQLAEGFCSNEQFDAPLRKVIAGSEQLQITPAITRLFTNLEQSSLHNEYGPSEAHVVTALALPLETEQWPKRPAVGRPISNTQIYLLDRYFNPTPIGVPGELLIGGVGLARGYLTLPSVTAEKFIPDPFSDQPGARLYRTGDFARYLPDGNIEFLGRMDHQLKIRGFRIEPGEIEVVLGQYPGVQEAVVLAQEYAPGDKRLVAYVVSQEEPALTVSALRSYLKEKLPEYMVPSAFVMLDELPLTPNGKVERRALPIPDQTRPELEQAFVAPRTALEEVLVKTCGELLGLERVGIHDSFFDLGGHSLLATQLVSRLCDLFQMELPLRAVFETPTVSGLAQRMLQEEPQPGEFEKLAQILQQLDELSDNEAQEMLSGSSFQPA